MIPKGNFLFQNICCGPVYVFWNNYLKIEKIFSIIADARSFWFVIFFLGVVSWCVVCGVWCVTVLIEDVGGIVGWRVDVGWVTRGRRQNIFVHSASLGRWKIHNGRCGFKCPWSDTTNTFIEGLTKAPYKFWD